MATGSNAKPSASSEVTKSRARNVYGANNEKIGSIARVMIGKRDGKVAFAFLSFGGFLGMGKDYYPVPWSSLDLRHRSGRLQDQHHRATADRRAEVQQRERLGLERS